MPPLSYSSGTHRRTESQQGQTYRPSTTTTTAAGGASATGGMILSPTKTRQYAHLHSQLAQLNAHLADTENLVRMTAVQAGDMRFLGGYVGGLFMGAAKVLGEEGFTATSTSTSGNGERDVKKE